MLRIPGRKFLKRTLRPLSRVFFPGAAVLGYHRVADTAWDPLELAVHPDNFAAQLEVLKSLREVVTVAELVALRAAGKRLNRYAALTFDDGYDDFATTVLPALEASQVPGTVFVATGFIDRSFWWDEIACLLAPNVSTPTTLEINVGNGVRWRYAGLESPERRAATTRDICNKLACSDSGEIRDIIRQLCEWAGVDGAPEPGYGAMNASQLSMLADSPLVDIGAHTVSHGCLGSLDVTAQRLEIGRSKLELDAMTGVGATIFSYPNGSYSPDTPGLLKPLGFSCSCTSLEGVFGRGSDPYLIPRIWVPNASGAAFRRWFEARAGSSN